MNTITHSRYLVLDVYAKNDFGKASRVAALAYANALGRYGDVIESEKILDILDNIKEQSTWPQLPNHMT